MLHGGVAQGRARRSQNSSNREDDVALKQPQDAREEGPGRQGALGIADDELPEKTEMVLWRRETCVSGLVETPFSSGIGGACK